MSAAVTLPLKVLIGSFVLLGFVLAQPDSGPGSADHEMLLTKLDPADPYEVLGLRPDDVLSNKFETTLKEQFRKKLKIATSAMVGRFGGDGQEAPERTTDDRLAFQMTVWQITAAFQVLRSQEYRILYEKEGIEGLYRANMWHHKVPKKAMADAFKRQQAKKNRHAGAEDAEEREKDNFVHNHVPYDEDHPDL